MWLLPLVIACGGAPPQPPAAEPPAAARHTTGAPCESCHGEAHAAWAASTHARAQGKTIDLGRFDGAPVVLPGLTATPARGSDGARFVVRDAAGDHTWPVVRTIGVHPLQQYVLEGDAGRWLVAPIAWDVAKGAWFDPAPDGAVGDPADAMYWAGMAGNWNHQCATCHTTGAVKAFDPATGAYGGTSAVHDGVGCVACHGAKGDWTPRTTAQQLDTCGGCHSRRRPLTCGDEPPSASYLDRWRPATVESGAWGPDLRIADVVEPFEWASFASSRMAAAGVTCTSCHDAHTGALSRPGDATCTGCHSVAALSTHVSQTDCVSCHMPTATYMGVHARHDHGFARPGDTRHAGVLAAGLAGQASSAAGLLALGLQPDASVFERASAIALLRRVPPPADAVRLRGAAADRDPLVRAEAVATLGAWGDAATAAAALEDPVRAVRFAAIEAFVTAGGDAARVRSAFDAVLAEVERLGACDDDVPSTHLSLGRLRAAVGDRDGSIAAFEAALRLSPGDATATRALQALRSVAP